MNKHNKFDFPSQRKNVLDLSEISGGVSETKPTKTDTFLSLFFIGAIVFVLIVLAAITQ